MTLMANERHVAQVVMTQFCWKNADEVAWKHTRIGEEENLYVQAMIGQCQNLMIDHSFQHKRDNESRRQAAKPATFLSELNQDNTFSVDRLMML